MREEVWKDVVGYEDLYIVSTTGKIHSKSVKSERKSRWGSFYVHNRKEHPVSFFKKANGYLSVHLYKNNIGKSFYVHRIVAEAFLDNPQNKEEVNHIDFNKENNNVENLEWCSKLENYKHALKKYKSFCNGKKIICLETGVIYKNSIEAGEKTGICPANIRMAISQKTNNHSAGGFKWEQI